MNKKPIGVNILDIKFYKYDEDGNELLNEDGTTKEFRLKANQPPEYGCFFDNIGLDDVEEI